MVARFALACLLAATPVLAQEQEDKPKVPKDSYLVTVTGCLKGRVIKADDARHVDTTSGPVIRGTAFRLAGKKEVMNAVKEEDGHHAEITGLIKKSSLMEQGIKKGGLKRPDDAKLRLGEAQIYAGKKNAGVATLKDVKGTDGTADMARLWILNARA